MSRLFLVCGDARPVNVVGEHDAEVESIPRRGCARNCHTGTLQSDGRTANQ